LIEQLLTESAAQKQRFAALRLENAALKARVAELERRLGLNSSNSGKPPSTVVLKKPPRTKGLREPSGKKSRGQKDHRGDTLRQVENPDVITNNYPPGCELRPKMTPKMGSTGYQSRQIFDVLEPKVVVTEHRAQFARTKPEFADLASPQSGAPEHVSYGENWAENSRQPSRIENKK
jgi:transposase